MLKRVFTFAAVLVGLVGSVHANNLYFKNMVAGRYDGSLNIQGTGIFPGGAFNSNVQGGAMNHWYDSNGNGIQNALETDFTGFCITPNRTLSNPQNQASESPYVYDMADGSRNTAADLHGGGAVLDTPWDQVSRLIEHGWASLSSGGAVEIQRRNIAFQLALWSIVSTGFINAEHLDGSNAAGTVDDYFSDYITMALNTNLVGKMVVFTPNTFPNSGQVIVTHAGGDGGFSDPVPEPFTMSLGIAAAALFVRRRAKAQKLA